MKNLRRNIRGVSPIIATLLLVAIAVAAAVVTYTWTMSLAQNNSQQAQTSAKVDQVLFGKGALGSEAVTDCSVLTQLEVADTSEFAVGDTVNIHEATVVLNNIRVITAIDTVTNILTISPALTLESGMVAADVVDALITKPTVEGLLISLRNTGSVAATIDTIYVFNGDNLISTNDLNVVVSTGDSEGIGIIDAAGAASGVQYWSNLKSGGVSLPAADSTNIGDLGAFGALTTNTPYTIRIVTSTGFIIEGTYYSPGSFT